MLETKDYQDKNVVHLLVEKGKLATLKSLLSSFASYPELRQLIIEGFFKDRNTVIEFAAKNEDFKMLHYLYDVLREYPGVLRPIVEQFVSRSRVTEQGLEYIIRVSSFETLKVLRATFLQDRESVKRALLENDKPNYGLLWKVLTKANREYAEVLLSDLAEDCEFMAHWSRRVFATDSTDANIFHHLAKETHQSIDFLVSIFGGFQELMMEALKKADRNGKTPINYAQNEETKTLIESIMCAKEPLGMQ